MVLLELLLPEEPFFPFFPDFLVPVLESSIVPLIFELSLELPEADEPDPDADEPDPEPDPVDPVPVVPVWANVRGNIAALIRSAKTVFFISILLGSLSAPPLIF